MNEPAKARFPSQIPFIIANEGCERFSFYGMRNILTPFLTTALLLGMPDKAARELAAKVVFHTFVIGVYFFPLLGGWLADRYFGKSHTIGNIWVVLANHSVKGAWITEHIRETGISVAAFLMFFFAAFAFAAAIVFRVYARRYKMTDHYRA